MKILALDIGDKRIGIATSDILGVSVWPQKKFLRQNIEQDFEKLAERIEEHEPEVIVVGLPVNMDGSEGPQAKKVRQFIAQLEKKLSEILSKSFSIEWVDERLSSWDAENKLREKGLKGKQVKEAVDSVAACLMLEDYLNNLARQSRT